MGIMELTAKKTIAHSHRKHMEDNEFTALFSEVEIDDSYSLNKFIDAEVEFEHIYKKLNLNKVVNGSYTFRVRKIKSNTTYARYYPKHNTLVVDVKHMDSFIHELGHLIDYGNGELSKADDNSPFDQLYKAYVANYKTHQTIGKQAYFTQRCEVFARCFECYIALTFDGLAIQKPLTALIAQKSIYPVFDDNIMKLTTQYFNNLFNFKKHLTAVG